MKRFCFRCKARVSLERVRRGSIYCTDECRRVAKIEALRERAKKKCRLCGNKLPKTLAVKALQRRERNRRCVPVTHEGT
jgi:ArsR family metal-binding transcriptional regulator